MFPFRLWDGLIGVFFCVGIDASWEIFGEIFYVPFFAFLPLFVSFFLLLESYFRSDVGCDLWTNDSKAGLLKKMFYLFNFSFLN